MDREDALGIRMPAVIAVLVQDIKQNGHDGGKPDGQTADIDQAIPRVAAKGPPSDAHIMKEHKWFINGHLLYDTVR